MAKTKTKKRTANGLRILDRRFGVRANSLSQRAQFIEQAEVAELLFAARTAAGLTQAQLAKAAGTTQQVVSQLEDADYQGHTLSMLRRIATALDHRIQIRLVPNAKTKAVV